MESSLGPLLPLLSRERAAERPVALGILIGTAGSTYRRPGALLLIGANGEYAGVLTGGCLEGDLAEHARTVIETGRARVLEYDLRNPDDLIWGLGAGCEGAMRIALLRVGPEERWQPLEHLCEAHAAHLETAVGIVVDSDVPEMPIGALALPEATAVNGPPELAPEARSALERSGLNEALASTARSAAPGWLEHSGRSRMFLLPLVLPPRVLVLGAGPDAEPLAELAARLHWKLTVLDHRPAYLQRARFPKAERLVTARPAGLSKAVDLSQFTAALVMSHHLPSDREYLLGLASSALPYIGLLGPPARRDKLLSELGTAGDSLVARLRAPVGLDLGGRSPEAIAVSIVAEILAFLHKRPHAGPKIEPP